MIHFLTFNLSPMLNSSLTLAYIGPGAGMTLLGSLVAAVGAVIALAFGFVWYPLRRLFRRRSARQRSHTTTGNNTRKDVH